MFYTLVENVRSLYNVGAIFRTADGAGIEKLFLTGITGRPPHREIRKVALGAEESVPWEYHADGVILAQELKKQGIRLVILETGEGSQLYDEAVYDFPICLVIGNEYHGVSQALCAEADMMVRLPMFGVKISLNVAVAFGIAAYEIIKQKNGARKK